MSWKTVCTGGLLLIWHIVSAASDPREEVRQLRSALAREQQAIVSLEKTREIHNEHLHNLQQTLAIQIKAAAKLAAEHRKKELLGYHTRLARSQIKLIDDIRTAEAANARLLNQRIQHQHTLKKLLLQEMQKTRLLSFSRPPPPSPPFPAASNDTQNSAAIRAIARGKVIFADALRGFGLMIIISHGNGYMSLYGRNIVLYTKTGDNVSKGQLIALADKKDNKAGKTAAERYFELRHNGTPLPLAQNTFILIQTGRSGRTPE